MRYVISVQAPDSARTSWRLLYRFTAIKHFHRLLRSKSEIWRSTRFALPAKGMLRSKNDPDVVGERCKALTKMLSLLNSTMNMLSNVHVIRFLCSKRHTRETVETEAGDLGVRIREKKKKITRMFKARNARIYHTFRTNSTKI